MREDSRSLTEASDPSDRWGLYQAGGRPVDQVNVLMLISELEGSYQHLKFMGFYEDMEVLNEMKKRYYKLYFKLKKEAKDNGQG